jgi:hypothetical protein
VRDKKVRYREGRFFPDGKSLLALSDHSGEVEFWRVPANRVGDGTPLTTDGKVLRWDGIPSSDGGRVAHFDKNQQLWSDRNFVSAVQCPWGMKPGERSPFQPDDETDLEDAGDREQKPETGDVRGGSVELRLRP